MIMCEVAFCFVIAYCDSMRVGERQCVFLCLCRNSRTHSQAPVNYASVNYDASFSGARDTVAYDAPPSALRK